MTEKNQPQQSGPETQASQHARAEAPTDTSAATVTPAQAQQQPQTQESHHRQLGHALQQHAQNKGWSLSDINWSAVGAAVDQLLEALLHGKQPVAS